MINKCWKSQFIFSWLFWYHRPRFSDWFSVTAAAGSCPLRRRSVHAACTAADSRHTRVDTRAGECSGVFSSHESHIYLRSWRRLKPELKQSKSDLNCSHSEEQVKKFSHGSFVWVTLCRHLWKQLREVLEGETSDLILFVVVHSMCLVFRVNTPGGKHACF